MDANDVYEKNSVLKEFVKTLEPDIADKDLQGFINDFLGIKEEIKEVVAPPAEKEPAPSDVKALNEQNQVLIQLLKEAVFQFLEKKYQEEKANRKPFEHNLIENVEKEDDADSYQLVEELGSMGISKISTDAFHASTPSNPHTHTKKSTKDKYFVVLSILGMLLLLAFLIVFFNTKYENVHSKDGGSALTPTSVNVVMDDTATAKAQISAGPSVLPPTKTNAVSLPSIVKDGGVEKRESDRNVLQVKESSIRANTENMGLAKGKGGSERKLKNRIAPKKEGSRKFNKVKKSRQHENVYFAEQE